MIAHRTPTVKTVGYGVTSLRDCEQYKSRVPQIHSGRNFLQDKLLARFLTKDSLSSTYAMQGGFRALSCSAVDETNRIGMHIPPSTIRNLTLCHSALSILLGGKR